MKDYTIKKVKEIIDKQEADGNIKDKSGYGITTAIFCKQFFNPLTEQAEYKEVYNYLFNKFEALK